MEPSSEANADLSARIRQQEVIAELGQRALEADDLDRTANSFRETRTPRRSSTSRRRSTASGT